MCAFICKGAFLALLLVFPHNQTFCSDFPVPQSSNDQIRFGSFNIEKLGKDSPYQARNAAVILGNYDIVAIQEVMNTGATKDDPVGQRGIKALRNIVSYLGEDWGYVLSPEPNGTANAERSRAFNTFEYYAFLYRRSKIEFIKDSAYLWDEASNPMPGVSDQERQFDREPFIASFRAKQGDLDFTVITIHAAAPAARWRRDEIERLALVYKTVQDSDPHQNDVLLMGDFNTNVGKLEWDPLKSLPGMKHILTSGDVTTLNKPSGRLSKSQYDTVWYQGAYSDEDMVLDSAQVHPAWKEALKVSKDAKIPQKIRGPESKKIWLYGKYASDHLPVTVLLWTDKDNDRFSN